MKRNEIGPAREYVLTHVPAEERMRIYAGARGYMKKELPKTAFLGVLPIAAGMIANHFTDQDMFLYGYIIGIGMVFLAFVCLTYRAAGALFRPPTQTEMDMIGDKIV